ncbi:hypothetical protein BX600DRAFT_484853 [Xylariales sp. PMI_506]|nr:hypothetical protein BX600DRAFT_484853 [Xylariales sp. PMI_506]
MDWYCNLTEHILNQDNIVVGKQSFHSVQNLLEGKVVTLYKALLLYQMKSACSFYRNQGLVFLNEKDIKCLQELYLTDPCYDKRRIEETKGGLLQDVYRWIIINPQFLHWRDSEGSLLWIKGDPGKGKTMLICGVIDELSTGTRLRDKQATTLLSYFFCQAPDSRINSATAILRGLIYMLLKQQPSLLPHARKTYDPVGESLFKDANSWVALSEILTSILQDPISKGTCLIIDALDECVTDLPKLLELIAKISSLYPHVKWIVSSRNWPNIEKGLNKATQRVKLSLELNEESVSTAVKAYIRYKVDQLAGPDPVNGDSPYTIEERDTIQHHLLSNAQSTFLWVALACEQLAEVSGWEAIEMVKAFPVGLNALYQRMLDHVCNSRQATLCQRILAVVLVVRRPITTDELTSLVAMPTGCAGNDHRLEEIIGFCGSFLTLRKRTISVVHQSAKDFLLENASDTVFPDGKEIVHHTIFSGSLQVMEETLRRNIYDLPFPGFPADQVKPPQPDPLASAKYSCVYWVDHLHCAPSQDANDLQDGGSVDKFLRRNLLYWLEALSLLKSISEGILSITKLDGLLQGKTSQLANLVRDGRRYVQYYKPVFDTSPLQVYTSALVFSPAYSMTRNLFQKEQPDWIITKPLMEDEWTACLQTFEGHSERVRSATFSPDGRLVTLQGHNDRVRSATFSPDGRLVTLKVWDPATGTCTQTLQGHNDLVDSATFSPDGRLVTLKVWDPATGTCTQTLQGHNGRVRSATFSPDGRLVVWDPATGTCTQTLQGHNGRVNSATFSPDGRFVVWDPATGTYTQTLQSHNGRVLSATFSPDGRFVTLKVWDPATGTCTQTLQSHNDWVNSATFSPDGRFVVSVWDPATGTCTQTLQGHNHWVNSATFSPDGRLVTLKVWDPATGTCTQTLQGHNDRVRSATFSPDGRLVTLKVWDPATGTCTQTLQGHNHWVNSATFSPDGRLVTLKVWDPATGTCTQTLQGHNDRVRSATFSPDGRLVTLKVWDLASSTCTKTFIIGRTLYNISFNASGSYLDTEIGIIDLGSLNPQQSLLHQRYGLSSDMTWITKGLENWLWLPPEYRPTCSAVAVSSVAIGCASGRVLIMTFL